ncbi:MAG: hypothetical protein M1818_003865 [Claussenomyces sp. TS43310]|nr:MAG: hypothetical protein M1818_003865 [Claussenomyces sp. TS43310]
MAATSLESHRSWILNLYESEHLSSAAIADYLNEYGVQTSLHEVQIHLDRWTPIRDPFPTGTVGREDDGSNLKTPSLNLGVMNHHGEHDISIAEPSETDNGATVLQRFMMTDQRHERLAYQLSVDEDIDLDDEIQK